MRLTWMVWQEPQRWTTCPRLAGRPRWRSAPCRRDTARRGRPGSCRGGRSTGSTGSGCGGVCRERRARTRGRSGGISDRTGGRRGAVGATGCGCVRAARRRAGKGNATLGKHSRKVVFPGGETRRSGAAAPCPGGAVGCGSRNAAGDGRRSIRPGAENRRVATPLAWQVSRRCSEGGCSAVSASKAGDPAGRGTARRIRESRAERAAVRLVGSATRSASSEPVLRSHHSIPVAIRIATQTSSIS